MQEVDEQLRKIIESLSPRVERAAAVLRDALKQTIPHDKFTGETARNVASKRIGVTLYHVTIPWPWAYHEYGYIHIPWGNRKAAKLRPPNPVAQRTVTALRGTLEAILTGES